MRELWKDIEGFEGYYQISNKDRVKSLKRTIQTRRGIRTYKQRILKASVNTSGYYVVGLAKIGVVVNKCIHRLKALAFIDNPHNKPNINHKDGNRLNNKLSNLEWCTQKENVHHALKNNLLKRGTNGRFY